MKEEQEQLLERQTVSFTGHRPDKLGGCYSLKHPESVKIMEKLTPILEQLIKEENIHRFVTGGAIGFDQIAFWTVQKLKGKYPDIKNVVAVPFKNQANKWTDKETLRWYNRMIEASDQVIYVDEITGYGMDGFLIGEYHVAKMQKRNEYMVDQSRVTVACWDGTKGGTGNCVNYVTKKRKTLFQMNPKNNYKLEVRYGMNH